MPERAEITPYRETRLTSERYKYTCADCDAPATVWVQTDDEDYSGPACADCATEVTTELREVFRADYMLLRW